MLEKLVAYVPEERTLIMAIKKTENNHYDEENIYEVTGYTFSEDEPTFEYREEFYIPKDKEQQYENDDKGDVIFCDVLDELYGYVPVCIMLHTE